MTKLQPGEVITAAEKDELTDDALDEAAGGLTYSLDEVFISSYSHGSGGGGAPSQG